MVLRYQSLSDFAVGTWLVFLSVFVLQRVLARIFHELLSRDREDGCATWQPQGVGPEAYLNGTSQGSTPEDAREDGHIVVAAGDS